MSKKHEIKVTKVRISKENVTIEYNEITEDGTREVNFSSEDKPQQSFQKAVDDLRRHVIEICELPGDYHNDLSINSISLKYQGDKNTMGCVISAKKELLHSQTPFNIQTPYKIMNDTGVELQGDPLYYLTDECIQAIGSVTGEAKLYLDGNRLGNNQMKLEENEFKIAPSRQATFASKRKKRIEVVVE